MVKKIALLFAIIISFTSCNCQKTHLIYYDITNETLKNEIKEFIKQVPPEEGRPDVVFVTLLQFTDSTNTLICYISRPLNLNVFFLDGIFFSKIDGHLVALSYYDCCTHPFKMPDESTWNYIKDLFKKDYKERNKKERCIEIVFDGGEEWTLSIVGDSLINKEIRFPQ